MQLASKNLDLGHSLTSPFGLGSDMRIAPLHVTEPLSCPSPHLAMSFLLLQFSMQFAVPYRTGKIYSTEGGGHYGCSDAVVLPEGHVPYYGIMVSFALITGGE